MGIRETLKSKPWAGWSLAGVLFIVMIWVWYRGLYGNSNPTSLERTTQEITIRDRETGEEWTMARGRMEQMLYERPMPIDPNQGLPNPKTGKLTGFPKSEWESTVDRISQERDLVAQKHPTKSKAGAPAPSPSTAGTK
jgi:hypothetical protein